MNTGWRGQAAQRASYPGQDPNRYTRRHRRFMAIDTCAQVAETLADRTRTLEATRQAGRPLTAAFRPSHSPVA